MYSGKIAVPPGGGGIVHSILKISKFHVFSQTPVEKIMCAIRRKSVFPYEMRDF
jgi:hypothetical protein